MRWMIIRWLKEMMAEALHKQDEILKENGKLRCADLEESEKLNGKLKTDLEEIRKENMTLKEKCNVYETALEKVREKVESKVEEGDRKISETQLQEIKKAWKQGQEEKVNFAEVVKQQIQEKTKDAVIQVIKEKQELVRDTVDKKKCMIVFGLKEKKNPVKFVREKEEKQVAKNLITRIQEEGQELEKEIEEVYRLGKYREGNSRSLKVKMRSQVRVEEILARTGKLAEKTEYKQIWVKREMS